MSLNLLPRNENIENNNGQENLIRGFIFACTNKSESECLSNLLFATDKMYGPVVIRIVKGDLLFLNNVDTNALFGVFRAISDGGVNIQTKAFDGRYPYQVKVEKLDEVIAISNAKDILDKLYIRRNTPIIKKKLIDLLSNFVELKQPNIQGFLIRDGSPHNSITEQIEKIRKNKAKINIEDEIPLIESTTFWDFPKQSYGITPKGKRFCQ